MLTWTGVLGDGIIDEHPIQSEEVSLMPLNDVQREQFQEFQMIGAHLLAHPRLRGLVDALVDDPDDNLEAVKVDPKKFLQSKGIELPETTTFKITRKSPFLISLCVGHAPADMYCLDIHLPEIHIVHAPTG